MEDIWGTCGDVDMREVVVVVVVVVESVGVGGRW